MKMLFWVFTDQFLNLRHSHEKFLVNQLQKYKNRSASMSFSLLYAHPISFVLIDSPIDDHLRSPLFKILIAVQRLPTHR